MASCITPTFGSSTCPQIRLTVTVGDDQHTYARLDWRLEYVAHGYAANTGSSRSYTVTIGNRSVSGSYDINGRTGTSTIREGSVTFDKATSSQSISFSCSMAFNLTWGSTYGGTKSASGSISISAKTSYTVSYNANGGSGVPGKQTKWYGTNIKLSSTKPTRTGYTFQGWATSSGGSVSYAAGATYSSNASVTLYAVWKAITYTVSYNANGGSGAPSAQIKTYGVTLTLSSTKPTRTNYTFKGWGTSASSSTVAYAAGASYTKNASITLYAIWQLAYKDPRITNLSADRCDSSGEESEEGKYARIKFNWACDRSVSSIKIEYKLSTASSWTSISVTASGTSGTVNKIIGGSFSTESTYDIRVTVTDSGGSSEATSDVAPMEYLIDFRPKGVAVGKPAEINELFDVGYEAMFRKGMRLCGTNTIVGTTDTPEDWAEYPNTIHWYNTDGNWVGKPTDYGWLINLTNEGSLRRQIWHATSSSGSGVFVRYGNADGWSDWVRLLDTYNYASYVLALGGFRFTSGWLGLYTSNADAKNQANRKGWIGYNGTTNLQIRNEAGGVIALSQSGGCNVRIGANIENRNALSVIGLNSDNSLTLGNSRRNSGENITLFGYAITFNGGSGGVNTNQAINNTSDRRLKKDITVIPDKYIGVWKELLPKMFMWNELSETNNDKIQFGLIAQDVIDAFEKHGLDYRDYNIVSSYMRDGEEYFMVSYDHYHMLTALTVGKQQKEIDELKNQVQELKELVLSMVKTCEGGKNV